MGRLDKETLSF